jgi:hypothetical protein
MIRKDQIQQWRQKHVEECGADNAHLVADHMTVQLRRMLDAKKVSPTEFSIRALFEGLVENAEDIMYRRNVSPQQVVEAVSASAFPNITGELIDRTIIAAYDRTIGDVGALVTEGDAVSFPDSTQAGYGAGDGLLEVPEFMDYQETGLSEKNVLIRIGKFGRMIGISREMVRFDQTNTILERAQAIGEESGAHRAQMIIETLEMRPRAAFATETTTTLRGFVYDGTAITQAQFYADTHATVIDKQVNDNAISNTLDTAGLDAAYDLFAKMVNEKGNKIMVTPRQLVIHPNLYGTAWQLVTSITAPDTANRAPNVYGPGGGRGGLQIVQSAYINTNTTWYIGNCSRQLMWRWGWRPETLTQGTNSDAYFEKDIITRYRFGYMGGVAHNDYRQIVRGGV